MSEPFPNADIIKVVSTAKQLESRDDVIECCDVCGGDILTMVFRGTRVCGEAHRKLRDNFGTPDQPKALNP